MDNSNVEMILLMQIKILLIIDNNDKIILVIMSNSNAEIILLIIGNNDVEMRVFQQKFRSHWYIYFYYLWKN